MNEVNFLARFHLDAELRITVELRLRSHKIILFHPISADRPQEGGVTAKTPAGGLRDVRPSERRNARPEKVEPFGRPRYLEWLKRHDLSPEGSKQETARRRTVRRSDATARRRRSPGLTRGWPACAIERRRSAPRGGRALPAPRRPFVGAVKHGSAVRRGHRSIVGVDLAARVALQVQLKPCARACGRARSNVSSTLRQPAHRPSHQAGVTIAPHQT